MQLPSRDKTSEEKMYPTMADADDAPKYPYGLCLNLDEQQLTQLGISDLPKVDQGITIHGKAKVTGASEHQTQGGSHRSLNLQITHMAIGGKGADE
jgi:hypothetical protein